VGIYAAHILKGAKASELPILLLTKYELIINLKATQAFGLNLSPTVLALADELID
jgi:putative ABC transport system substrate-binding protein